MKNKFYSLNDFLKDKFSQKVYKLSLSLACTCPNRDGTISDKACIFCSMVGSGDFAASKNLDIDSQIEDQIKLISNKFKGDKYIAYFQSFTNTYGDINYLRDKYLQAINNKNIVGIAIATRPDCLDEKVLKVLDEINKKTFLWIELGLQTSNDRIAQFINRGYKKEVFIEASKKLTDLNIKFVSHVIVGLPYEEENGYLETVKLAISAKSWGIKIHLLHILKNTLLEKLYYSKKFKVETMDSYIEKVVNILEILPSDMVVHRLTGDGNREELIEPIWSLNKRAVLNGIMKELKKRNTYQSKKFKGENNETSNC